MMTLSPAGRTAATMALTATLGIGGTLGVAGLLGSPSDGGTSKGSIDRQEALEMIALGSAGAAAAGLVASGIGAFNIPQGISQTSSVGVMRTLGAALGFAAVAGVAMLVRDALQV